MTIDLMYWIDSVTKTARNLIFPTRTGLSVEEDGRHDSAQEQIFENIRLHKEVLQSVKLQTWSMRRKLRLVRQAKEYVSRHEGVLQERFAMSRNTRDLMARFKLLVAAVSWRSQSQLFFNAVIIRHFRSGNTFAVN